MFTVVIPLYNKELSIKNTINSVLKQSYFNFEIIIVNDGSTDNSAQIVEAISDERIHLINQNNQGVSAARNRGIQEANYDWIAFLDGDDLWNTNHLQEIIEMIKKFPDEKVFVTSFEFSNKQMMFKHPRTEKISRIENYFKEAINEYIMWTSIVVVHKSCFEKVGKFNKKLNRGEDLDLWARLARNYKIIKNTTVTAVYRIDAENRTSLSKNLEKTFAYNLNFDLNNSKDENRYFRYILLKRCYEYILARDLKSLVNLKKKYPKINYIIIFSFSLKESIKRLTRIKTKFNQFYN